MKILHAISVDVPVLRSGCAGTFLHIDGDNSPLGACSLWVTDKGRLYVSTASDFFDALMLIRNILEAREIQLLCNGSRENVWPSAESRETEAGLIAYVCRPGEFATEGVDIFETVENAHYVTVSEQEAYVRRWMKSIDAM